MLYWTAAAWGSAIALGKDRPEMLADLPAIRALMERGLALDEGYEGGAIHEALILLDALPESMGGSEARARRHFARAVGAVARHEGLALRHAGPDRLRAQAGPRGVRVAAEPRASSSTPTPTRRSGWSPP